MNSFCEYIKFDTSKENGFVRDTPIEFNKNKSYGNRIILNGEIYLILKCLELVLYYLPRSSKTWIPIYTLSISLNIPSQRDLWILEIELFLK